MKITRFWGKYEFLSNFYRREFACDGSTWLTVEHAYQAQKTLDPVQREVIRHQPTPGKAKREGRNVTLRADWEQIKVWVMRGILIAKFTQHPDLRQALLDTGDAELIEGNTWGDTFWGVCRGVGENRLGKLLMELREKFRESDNTNA